MPKQLNVPKHVHKDDVSIEASVSQADAAELLNVSRSAVQRAKVVQEHGIPELIEAVQDGRVSVSAAEPIAMLKLVTCAYMGDLASIQTLFDGWQDETARAVACEVEERLLRHATTGR
jgi:hypothetical protein